MFQNTAFVFYGDWGGASTSTKLSVSARAESDASQNYNMLLTENLTTETVTSIINFSSVDYGEVVVPDGAISVITKGPATFTKCENLCSYVAGRLQETDTEFRQSYADKVFNLSDRTLQAIKAAILTNVQGVNSVAVYENDQDYTDAESTQGYSCCYQSRRCRSHALGH